MTTLTTLTTIQHLLVGAIIGIIIAVLVFQITLYFEEKKQEAENEKMTNFEFYINEYIGKLYDLKLEDYYVVQRDSINVGYICLVDYLHHCMIMESDNEYNLKKWIVKEHIIK